MNKDDGCGCDECGCDIDDDEVNPGLEKLYEYESLFVEGEANTNVKGNNISGEIIGQKEEQLLRKSVRRSLSFAIFSLLILCGGMWIYNLVNLTDPAAVIINLISYPIGLIIVGITIGSFMNSFEDMAVKYMLGEDN